MTYVLIVVHTHKATTAVTTVTIAPVVRVLHMLFGVF
jgi:hypothetical protein